MPEQTRVERPSRWEDVAGIGEGRARKLRQEVGRFDGTFSDIRDTRQQREILARSTSGSAQNLPNYAENAVQAARDPSPDVVGADLVTTRQVDQRTAQSRSRTEIQATNRRDDRREQGFETMERDPEDLDRAAERFTDEFGGRFDVPAADLGRTAREQLPDDRATAQPLINTAGSRTVFQARDPGGGFRQELERQTEQSDRATASPGEMADAFVEFVDRSVGLDPQPRRSADSPLFETPVAPQATDIGRRASGRFDRTHREPEISTEPIARDQQTGRFQVDPFDLTPGYEGAPPVEREPRKIEFGGEQVDLTQRDTEDLEQMNDFFTRNVDAEVDAERARGGFGTSDFAQEMSERQVEVASELDQRRR